MQSVLKNDKCNKVFFRRINNPLAIFQEGDSESAQAQKWLKCLQSGFLPYQGKVQVK
jgi:hypothetical protein